MLGIPQRAIARFTAAGGETTFTFSDIATLIAALPFTARHIFISGSVQATSGTPSMLVRIDADSGTNYNQQNLTGAASTVAAARASAATSFDVIGTLNATANLFTSFELNIGDAFSTRGHKALVGISGEQESEVRLSGGRYSATPASIGSVTVLVDSSSFAAGSIVTLWVADEQYLVAEKILTADGTLDISGLPRRRGRLGVIASLRGAASAAEVNAILNFEDDATDANYERQDMDGINTTDNSTDASDDLVAAMPGDTADANSFGVLVASIGYPALRTDDPHVLTLSGHHASSTVTKVQLNSSRRNNVESIEKLEILPSSGTWKAGSMISVYDSNKVVLTQKVVELAAADVTLTIPTGFRDLEIEGYARSTTAVTLESLVVEINSDSTTDNYDRQQLKAVDSTTPAAAASASSQEAAEIPGASAAANVFGAFSAFMPEYLSTARHKSLLTLYGGAEEVVGAISHRWENTAAVTQIKLTGNFAAGTIITVYGNGKDSLGWEDQPIQRGSLVGFGYKLEVDWAGNGAMVELSDITADLISLAWENGRSPGTSQLTGRASAGKLTAKLRNNSDQFSKNNASGPYFGNILAGRKVRLWDVIHGQIVFSGELVNPQTRVTFPVHKTATFVAFGIISKVQIPSINLAEQVSITTGALIDAAIDEAGLTSGDHDIDVGKTTVDEYYKADKQKALGAIREFEFTEAGFLRENHHLDGILAFEDRHHRLSPPHQVSQATFGDGNVAGEFGFDQIVPNDGINLLFNEFVARVFGFTEQSIADVWTHPEANTDGGAPSILPGATLEVWTNYPNPATTPEGRYIKLWTTPVSTTDYTANTQADGAGSDRTADVGMVADLKRSNAMKLLVTNNNATDTIFLTLLKARGTAVFADDPVVVRVEDTASQAEFTQGIPKTWERRAEAKWVPTSKEALKWCQFSLSIYKDPTPTEVMGFKGNISLYQSREAAIRQVSDRIHLTLTGSNGTGLDTDADRFVEKVLHRVNLKGVHRATYHLTDAAGFSDFWVLGFSKLGISTRLAY